MYASQNLYIYTVKVEGSRLLVSEIAAILENGRHNRPFIIWLGTIATFTCFDITSMCVKVHAFTTTCTICFSNLLDYINFP